MGIKHQVTYSILLCCAGQYDIDGNGLLDILLVSTSGEIIFYRHDGLLFNQLSYQVSVLVLVYIYIYHIYILIYIYHHTVVLQCSLA